MKPKANQAKGKKVLELTADDVWKIRQSNYAFHLDLRNKAKQYEGTFQSFMVNACATFDRPKLNFYANWSGDYFDGANWDRLLTASKMYATEVHLLVWWYWSDEGWAAFVDEFNALPEPDKVSTARVDKSVGIYPHVVDNSPVIHTDAEKVSRRLKP